MALGRRGGGFPSAGCGVAGGLRGSPLVLTGHDPAAPEEDELQRHTPGHRGSAPGETEGPEDTVHRAQRQWQEHERVSGPDAGLAGGGLGARAPTSRSSFLYRNTITK